MTLSYLDVTTDTPGVTQFK